MKNIKFSGIVAVLAAIAISVAGCDQSSDPTPQPSQPPQQESIPANLVGTWVDAVWGDTLTLRANGTFTLVFDGFPENGTFSVSGNSLTMTFPGEGPETGTFSQVGNTLTLFLWGEQMVFTRQGAGYQPSPPLPGPTPPPPPPPAQPLTYWRAIQIAEERYFGDFFLMLVNWDSATNTLIATHRVHGPFIAVLGGNAQAQFNFHYQVEITFSGGTTDATITSVRYRTVTTSGTATFVALSGLSQAPSNNNPLFEPWTSSSSVTATVNRILNVLLTRRSGDTFTFRGTPNTRITFPL